MLNLSEGGVEMQDEGSEVQYCANLATFLSGT